MDRAERIYAIVCAATIGYCIAYVGSDYGGWTKLTYLPYEREWEWIAGHPGAVPMGYVGTIVWGLGGALVGAALGTVLTRVLDRPLGRRWTLLLGAWALTAFVFGGTYFTWNLWPF